MQLHHDFFIKHMQKQNLFFLMQMQTCKIYLQKNLLTHCQKVSTFSFLSAIPCPSTLFF